MTVVEASSISVEELEAIRALTPAELREALRRCRVKADAYLRRAAIIEAWSEGKANGLRRN
jgi:hypothetical protein